jgi:hypothetical protein
LSEISAKNREVIEEYFGHATVDPAATRPFYAEDCVLHYGGAHKLSGDYHGVEGVLRLFERSAGTFKTPLRLRPMDLATSDEHVVALVNVTVGESPADEESWLRAVVFRLVDGRISEQWLLDYDQALVARLQP